MKVYNKVSIYLSTSSYCKLNLINLNQTTETIYYLVCQFHFSSSSKIYLYWFKVLQNQFQVKSLNTAQIPSNELQSSRTYIYSKLCFGSQLERHPVLNALKHTRSPKTGVQYQRYFLWTRLKQFFGIHLRVKSSQYLALWCRTESSPSILWEDVAITSHVKYSFKNHWHLEKNDNLISSVMTWRLINYKLAVNIKRAT